MTNQEKIRRIQEWQEANFLHSLTCANSDHGDLLPIEEEGNIVLVCQTCTYKQKRIPHIVYTVDIPTMEEHLNNIFKPRT